MDYYKNTKPKILYIIAQKRNLARFGLKSDNEIATPAAGTVLDTGVTGQDEKDFFMISHKAIMVLLNFS